MADKTGIEWTDATWNPVTGCAKVSQGCKHCYAEREWPRMTKLVPAYAGREFTDVQTHADRLDQPLRWKKPRMIFVNSMSDLFHEAVPDEFIDKVFAVMALATQHTFQVLTKRAVRMREYLTANDLVGRVIREAFRMDCEGGAWMNADRHIGGYSIMPLQNVWLGVSVEDQDAANERIPLLLDTPAAVRWISAEPLLGPVDLNRILVNPERGFHVSALHEQHDDCYYQSNAQLDWVVVGGESGPKARPMHPDWAYALQAQCEGAAVPFLFKQWGEWVSAGQPAFGTVKGEVRHIRSDGSFWGDDLPEDENADVLTVVKVGKKSAGRLLGGVQHDGYPRSA